MKRALLFAGVCGGLLSPWGWAVAEEPSTAAQLLGPAFVTSFCLPASLTEPPQTGGLLSASEHGAVSSACSRSISLPQMVGGASVGLYRIGGNEAVIPVNRLFGTVNVSALPMAKLPAVPH
jgi:hypothetical protein